LNKKFFSKIKFEPISFQNFIPAKNILFADNFKDN